MINLAQSNNRVAVGTLFYEVPDKTAKKNTTSCIPKTASASASARPPQPINRAAEGAAGPYCRTFDFTIHNILLSILRRKRFAAGNDGNA